MDGSIVRRTSTALAVFACAASLSGAVANSAGAEPEVGLGTPGVVTPPSQGQPTGPSPCTGTRRVVCRFPYTGGAQLFNVPPGITSATITARGAQGGAMA